MNQSYLHIINNNKIKQWYFEVSYPGSFLFLFNDQTRRMSFRFSFCPMISIKSFLVLFSLGQVIRTSSILLVPFLSIGPLRVLENCSRGWNCTGIFLSLFSCQEESLTMFLSLLLTVRHTSMDSTSPASLLIG